MPKFELIRDHLSLGHGAERYGVTLLQPDTSIFFMLSNHRNAMAARNEIKHLLCQLNDDWMRRISEYLKEARQSLEGNIKYFKVTEKKSLITKKNKLVERYFSEAG